MDKIGLFYGTDRGFTEGVASLVKEAIGTEKIEVHNIYDCKPSNFNGYNFIIIGLSTWYDGELQSDWDDFLENFKTINFSSKTVAFFGLGDQVGYPEYFIDGVGILAEIVYQNGGEIIGVWPTDGYQYTASKAEFENGWFLGLAIDEDNQPEMTIERVEVWAAQVLEEFAKNE